MNKQKGIAHLLLVIVVVVVGIGGLLLYSRQKGLTKTAPTQKSSPTPTITATENWETYFDKIYYYSIKYPSDWTIPQSNPLQRNSPNGEILYFIQANAFFNECMELISNSTKNISGKTFNLQYYSGVGVGEICQATELSKLNQIWFMLPEGEYGFVYQYPKELENNAGQFIEQVVSTFRFIPISRLDEANWKTLKSGSIGISLSFPSNFSTKEEYGSELTITGEYKGDPIKLFIASDFEGSPCANAPCDKSKLILLTTGENIVEVAQIWPYTNGEYTFKAVAIRPTPADGKVSVSIYGYYNDENSLELINQILSTFQFTE